MKANTAQWLDIIGKVLFFIVTMFVAVVAFEGQTLIRAMHDHEKRLAAIEANRYTTTDALTDYREINTAINDLKTWIESRYPPEWLRGDVEELKTEVKDLRTMMQRHYMQPPP